MQSVSSLYLSPFLTDSQCINQEDENERSQQVKIMQHIYRNAQEVIVFMGDSRGHRIDRAQSALPPKLPETTLYGDG